jgi:hypothetical protein
MLFSKLLEPFSACRNSAVGYTIVMRVASVVRSNVKGSHFVWGGQGINNFESLGESIVRSVLLVFVVANGDYVVSLLRSAEHQVSVIESTEGRLHSRFEKVLFR